MLAALAHTILASADTGEHRRDHVPWTPDREREDHALAARIRAGDEHAFRALMHAYFGRLARFTYSIVGTRDLADDIAQDVLASVWEQREDWHPERSIKTYLFSAARYRALNELRHRAVRAKSAPLIEVAMTERSDTPDVHEQLTVDVAVARLRVAVAQLSERRQTALRLRYEEGLTYPAIAAILGVSVKSAEQLVALSIQTLRTALGVSKPNR